MRDTLIKNLRARFAAYDELASELDNESLQAKLDIEKHKSIAEHLWCIVGSRESHARAIEKGEWDGFSCSMESFTQEDFVQKLLQSAGAVNSALDSVQHWSEEQNQLLANLAEHEVMHEGQIIRHVLGTGNHLPKSWKWA